MKASHFWLISLSTFALNLGSTVSLAQQSWPAKPIRLIVPFTSGAASDFLGRTLGQRLNEIYGQQVVVDNRPGAGGLIGSELTRDAPPDGYTITMIGQPHISNVLLRQKKPYDPIADYASISLVAFTHNVIVLGQGVNAKTIPDLVNLARAQPGKLNYGSAGNGSSSHLAGALFAAKTNINVVHIPFRQSSDSRSALISGTIHFYVYPLPAILGAVRSGQIKALAVGSPKRAEALPDIPTAAEAGFAGYRSESWFGLIGPKKIPKAIIHKLNSDIEKTLQEEDIRKKFANQGATPLGGSALDFEKRQREEVIELSTLIKQSGMQLQ